MKHGLNSAKGRKRIALLVMIAYVVIIGVITLGRRGYNPHNSILYWDYIRRNIQLIPGKTILEMIGLTGNPAISKLAALNIIGNLFLLTPLGICCPMVFPFMKRLRNFMLCMVAFVFVIEAIQLFSLKGAFDMDDFLLNLVGAALGFAISRICQRV